MPNLQENKDVYLESPDLYLSKGGLLTRKRPVQEYDEEVKGPQLQKSLAMWCYCETETATDKTRKEGKHLGRKPHGGVKLKASHVNYLLQHGPNLLKALKWLLHMFVPKSVIQCGGTTGIQLHNVKVIAMWIQIMRKGGAREMKRENVGHEGGDNPKPPNKVDENSSARTTSLRGGESHGRLNFTSRCQNVSTFVS